MDELGLALGSVIAFLIGAFFVLVMVGMCMWAGFAFGSAIADVFNMDEKNCGILGALIALAFAIYSLFLSGSALIGL